MAAESRIKEALQILIQLGMPKGQRNDRTALCLLALVNIGPSKPWKEAESRMIGITPIMEFARKDYGRKYAPNSRETFRRFSMHQLVDAGLALPNPDKPTRPVNSPKTVYQIAPAAHDLIRTYGSAQWDSALREFIDTSGTLAARYKKEREMRRLPVKLSTGEPVSLSPGEHSELIRAIIEDFAQRFVPGAILVYAGDTGEKWGYFDRSLLSDLGVSVDDHGKMPDVVLFFPARKWLLLVEAVTSHGPVDSKRHTELTKLFRGASAGIVYVTAFPSRSVMSRYLGEIAWETEVWVADAPSHLIHFNGERFLGPY